MTSLHAYEAYLDSLDECFLRHGSEVHVNFSRPFIMDLKRCSSVEGMFREARKLTVRLVEEPGSVSIQYLVNRFILLALEYHDALDAPEARRPRRAGDGRTRRTQQERMDEAKRLSDSIGLTGIGDVVRAKDPARGYPSVRFENGVGRYAGRHYVEFERIGRDAVGVNRSEIGRSGQMKLSAEITSLDAVEAGRSLLLFLPEPLSWTGDPPAEAVLGYLQHATRIQLAHSFTGSELQAIRADFQTLMEGLSFTYWVRNS